MIVNIEYLQHRCYAVAFQGKRRLVILLLLETQCGTKRGLLISVTVWSSLSQWEKSHGTSFWRPYRRPQWLYCFFENFQEKATCQLSSFIHRKPSECGTKRALLKSSSQSQAGLLCLSERQVDKQSKDRSWDEDPISWCGQYLHLRVLAHTGPRTLSRGQGGRFCVCELLVEVKMTRWKKKRKMIIRCIGWWSVWWCRGVEEFEASQQGPP